MPGAPDLSSFNENLSAYQYNQKLKSDLLTAKATEKSPIDDDTLSVSTIYFDIAGASADIEQVYYSKITGKKLQLIER